MAMEFLPVGAPLDSDIQQFCREANEFYRNYSRIVGPWLPGQSDGESTLDVEYLMAMGSKADNWYYTVTDGWVYSMAAGLANMTNPPQVVSVSYGWPELDSCDSSITGYRKLYDCDYACVCVCCVLEKVFQMLVMNNFCFSCHF
jgi:hypothetical protein